MSKDIHREPFDEGTLAKLAIFSEYLSEWLPVFLSSQKIYWRTVNIFDFFAGPGSDIIGTKGTPLIILEQLKPYLENIKARPLWVNLYFNEYSEEKCEQLVKNVKDNLPDNTKCSIEIDCLDFKDAFSKTLPMMSNPDSANLLFLDQNGIRHIDEDLFQQIISLKHTDFLFFISSSTIKRFPEHPNIAQYIKLSPEEVEQTPYHHIHRLVLEYYRSLIPRTKEYYLAPFSLKKNSNIYGIIFGSGNVLGIEKFLKACWKMDPDRGEANFDIDEEYIPKGQMDLLTGDIAKPRKVELFEKELVDSILTGKFKTDKDIYLFAIENGFRPTHAGAITRKLMSERKIEKCSLDLSNRVCKPSALITKIKII